NFGFIRAKTYRYGADLIIEACNKLKDLNKKFDLESTKKFISDAIDLCVDTNILNDSEILKYYNTQMNSSINFCEEALNNFKNFKNTLKKALPEDKFKSLKKSCEMVLSYLMDSLEAQKEHVEVLESYLNVKIPIIIKSSKYRVLIVDNDKNVQKLVTSYFKDKGLSTRSAMSSFEALLLLRHSKPDVILLDIALSDINGIDLCKRLRTNRNYCDVKIYFLTAHSDGFKEINDLLEQKVVDGLIKKPFGKNDFNFLFKYLESS
ncbi:MAG: PleD family two-component system response regulator, partial [Promethearchaeota archaeon]